jgi:hypothetical protein
MVLIIAFMKTIFSGFSKENGLHRLYEDHFLWFSKGFGLHRPYEDHFPWFFKGVWSS